MEHRNASPEIIIALPSTGRILRGPFRDVRASYIIERELGRGQFGVICICTDKKTRRQFACKSIAKRKLLHPEDIEDVRREVQVMHFLSGTPNIVELKGAYEDKLAVHLVMELCTGGDLFDHIASQGKYTERAAAALCRTIVRVIQSCHSMGVMHRDLKPENLLFLNKNANSPLKATDFGLAVFFKAGETFHDVVGSSYYIAPEVLRANYGPEADVWSAGVILYILLCGSPPFSPGSDKDPDIFKAILEGKLDLTSNPWPSISEGAKDLVRKMLTQDPKRRPRARELLNHAWIRVDGEAPDTPLDSAVLIRMKQFRAMNKLKKVALKVVAERLSEEEIAGLKQVFESMDTDRSGTISFEELKKGLALQGSNLIDTEIQQLLESVDMSKRGSIDYKQFINATINMNKIDKEDHLFAAFQYFDKDSSGFITKDELEVALRQNNIMNGESIQEILAETDTNNDGMIDYEEFSVMMHKGRDAPPPYNLKRKPVPTAAEDNRSQ